MAVLLSRLARHHHGNEPARSVVDRVQDRVGDLGLRGVEGPADDVRREAFDGGHGVIVHTSMVARYKKRGMLILADLSVYF